MFYINWYVNTGTIYTNTGMFYENTGTSNVNTGTFYVNTGTLYVNTGTLYVNTLHSICSRLAKKLVFIEITIIWRLHLAYHRLYAGKAEEREDFSGGTIKCFKKWWEIFIHQGSWWFLPSYLTITNN